MRGDGYLISGHSIDNPLHGVFVNEVPSRIDSDPTMPELRLVADLRAFDHDEHLPDVIVLNQLEQRLQSMSGSEVVLRRNDSNKLEKTQLLHPNFPSA